MSQTKQNGRNLFTQKLTWLQQIKIFLNVHFIAHTWMRTVTLSSMKIIIATLDRQTILWEMGQVMLEFQQYVTRLDFYHQHASAMSMQLLCNSLSFYCPIVLKFYQQYVDILSWMSMQTRVKNWVSYFGALMILVSPLNEFIFTSTARLKLKKRALDKQFNSRVLN